MQESSAEARRDWDTLVRESREPSTFGDDREIQSKTQCAFLRVLCSLYEWLYNVPDAVYRMLCVLMHLGVHGKRSKWTREGRNASCS